MFKIIKKDNIPDLIKELSELETYEYMNSDIVVLDPDIDKLMIDVYLRCWDTLKLGSNELKNILSIVDGLNTELYLGYDQFDMAYNLIDLELFIDELSKNNIKLVDYKFNWFLEKWINKVCIILWRDNEFILYR